MAVGNLSIDSANQ